jgi:hypothetical protein
MGDAIKTPFDVFVFFLVFVGIPALIFGGPIAVLGFLSVRRSIQLNKKRRNAAVNSLLNPSESEVNSFSMSPGLPWLIAVILFVIVGAIVFLVFGASISQVLMLN